MYTRAHAILRNNAAARYVAVGGASYAVELLCIYAIQLWTHNNLLAVGVSFWIGLVMSFLLQKLVAFKNTARGGRTLTGQALAYSLLVFINYSFTLGFSWLLSPLSGIFIARTAALIVTTTWNYFAYKYVIFKQA